MHKVLAPRRERSRIGGLLLKLVIKSIAGALVLVLAQGSIRVLQAESEGRVDPRGPIPSAGEPLVNGDGVQALHSAPALPAGTGEWQPTWIWPEASAGSTPLAAHFRRSISLAPGAEVREARAKVSADQIYRLWVNGHLVSRGPADPGADVALSKDWSHAWLYDTVDLKPFLHPGTNVIAAEVLETDLLSSYSLGHPGFAFEARIATTRQPDVLVKSDNVWQAQAVAAYSVGDFEPAGTRSRGTGLRYDARQDSPDWRQASGQGEGAPWSAAQPIESVWGTLLPSRIPRGMEVEWPAANIEDATANVTATGPLNEPSHGTRVDGPGSFSLRFDRILSAFVSLRVHGQAGTIVTLEPAEARVGSSPRRSMQLTLREGETIFEYPEYDSFSTIRVTVANTNQPVTFSDITAEFISQPVTYQGSFESSDPGLNALWKAARWQTQICMQDHYLDSPNHQEPLGDFGDYLVEALENEYAFGAPALTRQDLEKFARILSHADSVNFHTSYALLWLQTLVDYYNYTGDASLVRELKPTVDALLDHFATFRGSNGILSEAPNYMFMDWVTIGGFPTHHPPAVIGQGYLTAFYYRALADGMQVAQIEGDSARKAKYAELRRSLALAFERELWDERAGLYRDGKPGQNHMPLGRWLPADTQIETHSAHVNALAVLYDLAPRDRQQAILEKLFAVPALNVQPYFMHFVFAAEDHAGLFNHYAWGQMQRWRLNPETHSFPEDWNEGDLSHAWGGTPLIQMSSLILGVTPALPGFKKISLAPHPSGLKFAKGSVPTPLGLVHVEWSETDTAFSLHLLAPDASSVEVTLPEAPAEGDALLVDGKSTSFKPGVTALPISLTGGSHTVVLRHGAPAYALR